MTDTPLDAAYAAMEDSDAARLRFYALLADTELLVLLEREAEGEQIEPRLFPTEDGDLVLAFDSEARLSDFVGGMAAYAILPGRVLAQLLAAEGLSLGLNLGVAPSETILPAAALAWLVETLAAQTPDEAERRVSQVAAPGNLPATLLEALAEKLAKAHGTAQSALLAKAIYDDGSRGHLLALLGAGARAEAALARAVSEALVFSGVEAGALDVVFLAPDAPLAQRLQGVALRFDVPEPAAPDPVQPAAPGSDPARPPKLR